MVMIDIKGTPRYYDGYMASNLDLLKEAVEKKFDGVVYIGGYEGSGKSTLAQQFAVYVDPTFCLDRVCFSMKEFAQRINESSIGQAIVYDESWKDVNSGARYSHNSQEFIRLLTENRKKRLFIFVVAATFFDINKYLLIHRSRAYIEVYTKGLDRGFFAFYDRDRKKDLYIRGKRDWNMNLIKPTFRGSFVNWLAVDEAAYEEKKDLAIKSKIEDEKVVDEKVEKEIRRKGIIDVVEYLKRNRFLKAGAINAVADFLNVNVRTVGRYAEESRADMAAGPLIELKMPNTGKNEELSNEIE